MKEVVNIRQFEQAKVLMNPIRIQLLNLLLAEKTCAELAEITQLKPQRVNAHLKELLSAQLIKISKTRQVRNLTEATYIACGKAYWMSPEILRDAKSDRQFRDELSLNNLLVLAETIQHDVGLLLGSADDCEVPSIGISAEICLRDEDERNEFSRDLLEALDGVFRKYQKTNDQKSKYVSMIMCYPKVEE